jgi:anti-sigma-K factor RskA
MPDLTPATPPEPWSELLAGYVLGDLTPAEICRVEQYLTEHPERSTEIGNLMATLDLLPLTLPAANPPTLLRQQILQVAESEAVVASSPMRPPQIRSSSGIWRSTLAGLGLLLLAGLGWHNYRLSHELATVKQDLATQIAQSQQSQTYQSVISLLQQPNNRFLALKNKAGKSMGMGSLVMVPTKSAAVLTLQQMAPLPTGQVYRMWAIMGDEEMACADFLPDAAGKVLMQIPLDSWKSAKKVMITIEQKGAKEAEGEVAIEGESSI